MRIWAAILVTKYYMNIENIASSDLSLANDLTELLRLFLSPRFLRSTDLYGDIHSIVGFDTVETDILQENLG